MNNKIAIKTKKALRFFPSYEGIITVKIESITHRPEQGIYELRLIDMCSKMELKEFPIPTMTGTEMVSKEIEVMQGAPHHRSKTMTYADLDALTTNFDFDRENLNERELMDEMFRQGLLLVTQMECAKGEGLYFSQAADWEIVR